MHSSRGLIALLATASLPSLALAQTGLESSSPPAGTSGTNDSASTASAPSGDSQISPQSIGATPVPVPPPSAGERTAATAPTPDHARSNEPEDNGRSTDFLFIQPEFGYAYVNLTALSSTGRVVPGLQTVQQSGYSGGLTVGFRSWIFALAAHGTIARFISGMPVVLPGVPVMQNQDFDIGQLMVEGQVRIPLPVIEPYARIGLGYAWIGAFQLNQMYMASTSEIHGFTGQVGAGLDVWLGKLFTIGAGADVGLTNLRRGGVMRAGSMCAMTDPTCIELTQDGDATGIVAHFHVQAGLHF